MLSEVAKKIHDPGMFKRGSFSTFNYLQSIGVWLLFKIGFAFFSWYAFAFLVNSAQGKLGEKYKFELKKATDISQRLDDVKGIDEIKEEI